LVHRSDYQQISISGKKKMTEKFSGTFLGKINQGENIKRIRRVIIILSRCTVFHDVAAQNSSWCQVSVWLLKVISKHLRRAGLK